MTTRFTHLHIHTQYSLLDGFCKINDLVKEVKNMGMDSIAITDHGDMFGVIDFYRACKAEGVKPILGCEVYMTDKDKEGRDPVLDKDNYHLILLAENEIGYQNLMKIVSTGYTKGFYYKPRADYDLLKKHSEGIIATSACIGGIVPQNIINGNIDEAKKHIETFIDIYGKDNFFIEIQDHFIPEEKTANETLIKLAQEYGLGLIATNDAHYIKKEDANTHDVLLCVQTGSNVNDSNRMKFYNDEFYLKSPEEMQELFRHVPEAIENTAKIADRCNVKIEFGNYHLPVYQLPKEAKNSTTYLKELCLSGLKRKYKEVTDELMERLESELKVINDMGFNDYFLIVWDFIKYARDNGISVGPGRGSAAGSLVSYTLDITLVDPIRYNLIFERFLNEERVSMPDIDIDFCYENRGKVIDYVIDKYGYDNVTQIATFGTLAPRAAVKDVARSMGISFQTSNEVSKAIPGDAKSIEDALNKNPELAKLVAEDSEIKKLIDISKQVEGMPRHVSTHAAGVVIADKPVSDYVPLCVSKGSVSTQFNMIVVEELGLLKMDFLGLRNLTVIQDTVDNIKESKNEIIDIDNIPYDDKKVYRTIANGDTLGIFQLESAGMRDFMRRLKPDTFEDVIAGISLYRPGPMDEIPTYIANKHNPAQITYLHPALEPILNVTYGCIVYQEQVMQIVRELAGFSMGRSDELRRAMGKKKMDVMEKERKVFLYGNDDDIHGCVSIGISEDIGNEIYDKMVEFAKYAFNKSHAAAYAVIAYQTAYLKTYYPVEFMAALLTSIMGNESKVKLYINHLSEKDIELLPPDVNISGLNFTVDKKAIRFGLMAVKGVGESAILEIIEARETKGKFESFMDFVKKLEFKSMNKRAVESLIKAGAFDSMGHKRNELLTIFEEYIDSTLKQKRNNIEGQLGLMDILGEDSKEELEFEIPSGIEELELDQKLAYEKEVLGMYISGHPLSPYKEDLARYTDTNIYDLTTAFSADSDEESLPDYNTALSKFKERDRVAIGGLVSAKREIYTKKNQLMAFLTLEDLTGHIDIVVFSRTYEEYRYLTDVDNKLIIEGTISIKDESSVSILADKIYDLTDRSTPPPVVNKAARQKENSKQRPARNNYRQQQPAKPQPRPSAAKTVNPTKPKKIIGDALILVLDEGNLKKLGNIKPILTKYSGDKKVILHNLVENKRYLANQSMWVDLDKNLIDELSTLIGASNIAIK